MKPPTLDHTARKCSGVISMPVCLAPGPMPSLVFPNMVETLRPWSPRTAQAVIGVIEQKKGPSGDPFREHRRGCEAVCLQSPGLSPLPRGAIWPTDVAQSQPLVFLGNEQGQERAQGLLQ